MHAPTHIVGLMSGTSLDGIDAVLIRFTDSHHNHVGEQITQYYMPYTPQLRQTLLALRFPSHDELHQSACVAVSLAQHYAECVHALLTSGQSLPTPTTIACHGQTIRHRPESGYSIQLLNAAKLVENTGLSVICDFRSRDIAAGGQGAPLVPAFHAAAFGHSQLNRVIINIGGIANITWLPAQGVINGFDCGPGNLLLDAWCQRHTGELFDRDGHWGSTGIIIPELLAQLISHPYFSQLPPKSAGYEQFNLEWLLQYLTGSEQAQDVQATLLELSVLGISLSIQKYCPSANELYFCGGGAHNVAMMRGIKQKLPHMLHAKTDVLGISADWLEAHAFAWLAWQTLQGKPANQPIITGATHPCILGAIYPA